MTKAPILAQARSWSPLRGRRPFFKPVLGPTNTCPLTNVTMGCNIIYNDGSGNWVLPTAPYYGKIFTNGANLSIIINLWANISCGNAQTQNPCQACVFFTTGYYYPNVYGGNVWQPLGGNAQAPNPPVGVTPIAIACNSTTNFQTSMTITLPVSPGPGGGVPGIAGNSLYTQMVITPPNNAGGCDTNCYNNGNNGGAGTWLQGWNNNVTWLPYPTN